jgi:hypothetical protein
MPLIGSSTAWTPSKGRWASSFARFASRPTASLPISTAISARDEQSFLNPRSAADLSAAADRAGEIVTEQIRAMIAAAEAQAHEIRQDAESDAERIRREAAASSAKLIERIDALDRPLGELVAGLRQELDGLSTDLRDRSANLDLPSDAVMEEPSATDTEAAAERRREELAAEEEGRRQEEEEGRRQEEEEERRRVEEADAQRRQQEQDQRRHQDAVEAARREQDDAERRLREEAEGEEDVAAAPQAEDVHVPSETSDEVEAPRERGGLFRRMRRARKRLFITEPGQCAVCNRTYAAANEEELAASGWRVSDDIGLCPTCQSEGWQLPEGARLPYRRGGG